MEENQKRTAGLAGGFGVGERRRSSENSREAWMPFQGLRAYPLRGFGTAFTNHSFWGGAWRVMRHLWGEVAGPAFAWWAALLAMPRPVIHY